jgi:hypothetical protein
MVRNGLKQVLVDQALWAPIAMMSYEGLDEEVSNFILLVDLFRRRYYTNWAQ